MGSSVPYLILYLLEEYLSSFAVDVHNNSYRAGAHYLSLRLVSVAKMEGILRLLIRELVCNKGYFFFVEEGLH